MYIRRHTDLFEGHITTEEGRTVLDAAAEKVLSDKYPYRIVEKEVDTESRELYLEALEKLTRVQDERDELRKLLMDQTRQISVTEAQAFLLEQKDDRIEQLKADLADQRKTANTCVTQMMLLQAEHKTALEEARLETELMRRKAANAEDRMREMELELEERKGWGIFRRLFDK